jgi:serine/threonine protein kinase
MLNFKQEWETLNVASKTHSPEIIKGYSALRTDKGKLVMVMEYAPHGSLDAFAEILRDAKERGLSDVQIIRIKAMLLGDIFRGIASTHRANVIHGDLKPHNIVIGKGGIAKITDFGTAQFGQHFAPSKSPPVDNPRWLGPEVLKARKKGVELGDIRTRLKKDLETFYSKSLNLKPQAAATVLEGITSNQVYEEKAKLTVGVESDYWALGAIAFYLANDGRDLVDENESGPHSTSIEEKLLEFRSDQIAVGHRNGDGTVTPGYFMTEDGGAFGGTVNLLLNADPEERRAGMDEVMRDWPSEEDLGGQKTRDLIIELASGQWKPSPKEASQTESVSDEESSTLVISDVSERSF